MKNYNVGDILVENFGYSMILYRFYKVTRVTPKFVQIHELDKVYVGGDDYRPLVAPTDNLSNRSMPKRISKKYAPPIWDEKPRQEDHLD
jgi:hypothetical protein